MRNLREAHRQPVIHVLASEPHYGEHMRPVFDALPDHLRGIYTDNPKHLPPGQTCIVSSTKDYRHTTGPVVFFEHGVGQKYDTNHTSYAGGPGKDRVILFCNTNRYVDEANRASYPHVPHVIVGCPKLDELQPGKPTEPVVAFSWHWDCRVAPETRTALNHYQDKLPRIAAAAPWTPLGHAHPRAWRRVQPLYTKWKWRTARTFDDVARQAAVYVCDTSSTIYEFAALGRPVVILNAPWYRRDVHHGLRFWENIPGIQVDHPDDLGDAIEQVLNADTWSEERKRITRLVYPHRGEAARRAADAIAALLTT